jgi:hypothetical protein
MKKISTFLFVAMLFTAARVMAAAGDTTTVVSHTLQIMDWNKFYDSAVTFPDGSTSYKRIMLEFELGKYHCTGYNPNNPGEGTGQTGWCADWDYDVHVIVMTPSGDTIELGEFITPYANSTFPATSGWAWKHSYMFDVTDYYSILKGDVTIRIHYSGYSGGFTGTTKFHFIEGTRARDVVGIQKLYHDNFQYGIAANPIESHVGEVNLDFPATAVSGSLRTIITGHGGISGSNCAEFCRKWLKYKFNGTDVLTKYIWNDGCGSNWLAPQSGTWVYNRANWCPGNLVEPWVVDLPSSITPGSSFTADIDFEPFTASEAGASYKMSTYAIYYGPYNYKHDAGIEEIIAPNAAQKMRLENAACGTAKVKVRNFGSETITSLKLGYQIVGGVMVDKTITTNILPEQTADIIIDGFNELNTMVGTNTFHAEILEVNGVADEDPINNVMTSSFVAVPQHAFNKFNIQLRTSGLTNASDNIVTWKVIDVSTGSVLFNRTGTAPNEVINDTMNLNQGCYKLVVETPGGMGLSFFRLFTSGYVRMFNTDRRTRIAMPGNDLGSTGLEGNFGNGFTYYFVVSTTTSISEIEKNMTINIYPNPATDVINIELNNVSINNATARLINVLGEVVLSQIINSSKVVIPTGSMPSGVYMLEVENDGIRKVEKVSILK